MEHAAVGDSVAKNSARGPEIGYRSLEEEVVVDDLPVDGTVPTWLRGSLLRNGPGLFDYSGQSVRHWFDGQAMLHRFTLAAGGVSYSNRFLRTKAYRAIREEGRLGYSEFASDPCRSIFKRIMTVFDPGITDNAAVSVSTLGGRHYAMTEAPLSVEFDPHTLETLGYGPKAPGTLATAHPHRDPGSGALVNVAIRFGPKSSYRFYLQEPGRRASALFSAGVREPGYVHSFAMSARYIALTEFPFVVNPIEIPLKGKPFIENFRWKPERGTRILVWDRHTREQIGTYETEPGFAFHHVGAWEEGGRLVMEYVDHGTPGIIDALYLDRLRSAERTVGRDRDPARLRRVSIDLGTGGIESELRSEQQIELPRINEERYLDRYRFVYGISATPEAEFDSADQLAKLDNETGESVTWSEDGCYPGEPVFVPDPAAGKEDAGVVLSVVLDAAAERSFLLVLDAASMEQLGRCYAPHVVPHGIHGAFYPQAGDEV
ncbi:MAG TPA: carotenoid oxygenase family protein [Solirubrobacterales bacterium]